ncbi:serine/threonine-protein kinase [Phytomonospora endophytica]|uniref:non-specific serine/threonine protein kinase n=1 Tax=Phytomonospora endophytica TaxID=714109 RepID=A0A841FEZ7_9ACTN|nr:serine/threonine-protein kinase [Phytomonospora endophytica]MBB6035881.1 tRNA A-37 threonylcarbamoyl transferase component Bud32 [Phytomonospora endophytica]GIG71124.1 hypothetical protein Pen01_74190 [Phytomonospora endophytica]
MTPGRLLAERYRLDERIGTGGMGDVWRAADVVLHRTVAIKILHPMLARDTRFRHRFTAEARTVAGLRAPGIVALHDAREDVDEHGDVTAYLVMEFVPGTTLADLLDRHGRLSPARTMRIIAQVAASLDTAHRAGIVHRDIKPGNIILGDNGEATLIDFGIAHGHGDPGLTATGLVMGTPSYASPEQLRDETLTGLSDVYSLGVVAYECLAGRTPFAASNPAAILTGHLHHEPPPLPVEVPGDVAALVGRTLAKHPSRRPPGAAALARECRVILAAPATEAMPARPAEPTTVPIRVEPPTRSVAEQARPHGRRVPVLLVSLLLIIAVAAAATWALNRRGGNGKGGEQPDAAASSPSVVHDVTDEPTPIMNAENERCLDIGAAGFSTLECDAELFQDFTFTGSEGVYTFADEGGKCARLDPESDGHAIIAGDCGEPDEWTVTWLRTEGDWDVWNFASVGGTAGFCLTAGAGERVKARDCTGGVDQEWRTKATES